MPVHRNVQYRMELKQSFAALPGILLLCVCVCVCTAVNLQKVLTRRGHLSGRSEGGAPQELDLDKTDMRFVKGTQKRVQVGNCFLIPT